MSRSTIPFPLPGDDTANRLNIGCGRHYHSAWTNLDLQSNDPNVICHDVTQGIPFGNEQFQAVYHSHILEHLSPVQGRELICECFRVLKPGGVLRIVVPNLEEIAQLYLTMHDMAWEGNEKASVNYHWMKMEMLDQLVRSQSGGLMGPYMATISDDQAQFVRSRLGSEFQLCRAPDVEPTDDQAVESLFSRLRSWMGGWKTGIAKRIVSWMMGRQAAVAFEESLFRSEGEIHRWMYDRFSLRELCQEVGFVEFTVQSAFESQIDGYENYQLDSVAGQIRKPDSLFIECRKPALGMRASA